jgi:hypothetical protein
VRGLRFGSFGLSFDQWLEGMGAWTLFQSGAASPLLSLKLLAAHDSALPTDTIAPPPSHDDSHAISPPGMTAESLAIDPPVIWLLPENESPPAPLLPLATGGGDSAASSSATPAAGIQEDSAPMAPPTLHPGGLFIDNDHIVLGAGIDSLVVPNGSDYYFTAADGVVEAGHTLTVSGRSLGAGNHLSFDGSAETGAHFMLEGGADSDLLVGGKAGDLLQGGGGADMLAGGGGADRFLYTSASDSTGAAHDTIVDFTFGEDVIDLPVTVQGLDAAVTGGALSQGSFDTDLSALLGGTIFEAGHALFVTPDSGDLAGHTFLVVDANGEAGYQPGADFVIELPSPPPVDFHGTGFLG